MYKQLYDWMVPRVGEKAAKAGLRVQYSGFLAVGMVVCLWLGMLVHTNWQLPLDGALGFLVLFIVYGAYARVQFASALSEYFNKEITWYQLPMVNSKRMFTLWLEKIQDPIPATPEQEEKVRTNRNIFLGTLVLIVAMPFMIQDTTILKIVSFVVMALCFVFLIRNNPRK